MATSAKLFEAGRIGNLEIKNRIVMAPMGTHWATEGGNVVQRHLDYYGERARGGVGLLITEACCVQFPQGRGFMQIRVDNDQCLPDMSRLAKAMKQNGARAAMQLHHAGAAATLQLTRGLTPVTPSGVPRRGVEPNRALSLAEIEELENCFINAALRAQKAGFDAVEIHGAHHYLLAQFHSPAWNERNDQYGGGIENRCRVMVNIVKGIKETAPGLPVICRFNGKEWGAEEFLGRPGLTLEDAQEIAGLVEAAGADAVHISAYGWGTKGTTNSPSSPGALLPLAEAVKRVVSIPVIAVGRLLPAVAEQALREGKADFTAIGRGLIADPYWPDKVRSGNLEDIAPCITCLQCLGRPRNNICTVNARDGQEGKYPYPMTKAARPKKVVVIGGGPGGMEAARVAALRGHSVTLYEKDRELGGKLRVVDKPSSKENMGLLNPYLQRQLKKAGVTVKLGTAATAENVLQEHPDAVIVATGAEPVRPQIQGLQKASVVEGEDYLDGKVDVGERVVIIGGEMVGCEIAELLSERGWKDITIVRRGSELLAKSRVPQLRYELLHRLRERGVKVHLGVTYKEATERGLVIIDKEGKEQLLEADTIVLAAGAESDNRLFLELKAKLPEVFAIGDALEPRLILQAIHEGFETAYTL